LDEHISLIVEEGSLPCASVVNSYLYGAASRWTRLQTPGEVEMDLQVAADT
jgi:hypothetical protein